MAINYRKTIKKNMYETWQIDQNILLELKLSSLQIILSYYL